MTPPQLSLPPQASPALTHCWTGRYSEDGLFPVYHLSGSNLTTACVKTICDELTAEYTHATLGDDIVEDYHQFLHPIDTPLPSVQACLDHHFKRLDNWLVDHDRDEDLDMYPFAMLVFESEDWKNNQGDLLVHFDRIRHRWYLGCLHLPFSEIANELTSLRFGDITFGDVCNNYDIKVPQNDPTIDPNYKDFEKDESGVWRNNPPQFAVFSMDKGNANTITDMLDDESYDVRFGHKNLETMILAEPYCRPDLEAVCSFFPKAVASDTRGENRHMRQGPCRDCRPLHPTIFICVDNEDSKNRGVLVCRLLWDKKTERRSDEELEQIGKKAKVVTKRVGVAFALNVARAMALEEDGSVTEGSGEKERFGDDGLDSLDEKT